MDTFPGGVDEMTNTKNPDTWKKRKLVVEEGEFFEEDLHCELSFTAELLRKDAKNKYAWSHRQWVLEALGKGYADELGFCNEILAKKHNVHNKLVWDQRCFAVKKCLALGLMIIRSCEVTFATRHISRNPENENPWRYLRFLCKGEMDALARNVHLQWALKCVFVEARERRQAVTTDFSVHKNKGHAVLFHSVNRRGCLFALNLVSDLLSHGYQPHKEVVDAINYLFKEFEGPTLAKRVDSVLQKHGKEVMELLSADLTRTIENMPGGMETSGCTTPLSDQLKNPSDFFWSKDRWVTAQCDGPSGIVVVYDPYPRSYSQLCGVAGFSQNPVLFFPEDPDLYGNMEKARETIDSNKRRDTGPVIAVKGGFRPDYDGDYKDLPELLKKVCWEIANVPDFNFDINTEAFVLHEGHTNPAAWQARRLFIHERKLDLQKDVEILELVSERNSDNYLYWHQRRWVSEKIGRTAAEKELEFTDYVLSKDAYNYHAWSHRQWVVEVLGEGCEVELEYCNKFLEKDSSNCFAWNQRYFVARVVCKRSGMMCKEVEYASNAIEAEPENEMPWTYLQSLMKLEECHHCLLHRERKDEMRGAILVDKICCESHGLSPTFGPVLKHFGQEPEFRSAMAKSTDAIQKKEEVNALKMALFALHNCPGSLHIFQRLVAKPPPKEEKFEQEFSQTLKYIDVTWI